MRSIERIQAAVAFQPTDRLPVIAQVFGHAAVVAGKTIHDYVRSGRELAHCQLKALDRYGYDCVFSVMDVNVETEALGSKLVYPLHDYPYVQSHAFTTGTNLDHVSIPDPFLQGRMPEILEALRILRREVGEETLVVGCILGPMTLAAQLVGMETALYLAIDDPDSFGKLLDFAVRVVVRFGAAQIEAGAHLPLVFDPSASTAVIPPSFFREFELPRLKKLFSELKDAGALSGWLHIAGPIAPILPFYEETGAGIFNFDYCVGPDEIMKAAPGLCFDGNIKSLDFETEEPESIFNQSLRLQQLFSTRGGFILSSGCEIPPGSRPENVAALVSATREGRTLCP